jgi:LacI family transcriptional regulator, repressor for deo operon, udp, cdd, tsx, nupC, and nupG
MPHMKPRLRDVAQRAGVSEATVSRVVNGRPGVAESTRREVLAALDALGYEPAGIPPAGTARPLAGVIAPELDNPVFPAFAMAIEARLARHGFTTVIGTATIEGTHETDYLTTFTERGAAGVVIVSGLHADTTAEHGHYRRLVDGGTALVLVNGPVAGLTVPCVCADDVAAAELGVRHLADLGHRRIGFASGPQRYVPSQRKLAGYLRGVEGLGLGVDEELIAETVYSVEGGQLAMARLLDRGVTGVLAGSDLMALGAIRAAKERGLSVPEDVSVVGYDDIALAAYTHPPLTTLRQPVRAMGTAAANLLVAAIEGARSGPGAEEYVFRPELIARGSSGPCREPAISA